MPAALVTVVSVTLLAVGLDRGTAGTRLDALAALANVANWRFVFSGSSYADLFQEPSPLQHFWSLAIEEQFYLVFPLVVFGVTVAFRGRRGPLVLTVGVRGVVSYGVYLIHWPVSLWLDASRTGITKLPLFLLQLVVTVALAASLYLLVEAPIRVGRLPVVPAPVRWWAAPADYRRRDRCARHHDQRPDVVARVQRGAEPRAGAREAPSR